MKRAFIVAVVAGTACLLSAAAAPRLLAQRGAPPPQSSPNTSPPKTTGLILGQVVDGTTGQPIAEAVVTLSGAGTRGGGAGLGAISGSGVSPQAQQALAAVAAQAGRGAAGPARVMTGADGRFVFHDLAPGNYQLTATLTGYTAVLTPNAGANAGIAGLLAAAMAPSGGPTSLAIKEGEFATGLKLRLWKNAVVSGTVLDDAGEPAIGLMVQVARRVMATGRARFVPSTTAHTDDRGMYRITGLTPGDYLVAVPQAQVSMPTAVMSGLIDTVTSGMSGGGSGGGLMAIMDIMSSGIMPTEAMSSGVRIGDFMVASSGSVPLMGADGRLQAYQTSFYPGVFAPAQATVVNLKSGEDKTAVNFQLSLISTSRVSGTAMGPDGPIANLGIRLVVPGDGVVSESEFDVSTAITKPDGTFSFFGVPPGQFLLRANKQPRPDIPAELLAQPGLGAMFGPAGQKGTNEMLFAVTGINVGNSDVDGVAVQLTPGFHVSGRLAFEGEGTRPQPTAQQIQTVVVSLVPMDGRSVGGILGDISGPDRANDKSEFRTKGYAPGKYFLNLSGSGPWQVKSAMIGGRDVLDAPLEVKDGDLTGLVVTFTDKLGGVTGVVRASGETDLSDATVLLFPANYQSWIESGMNPRRVRTARANRAGGYTLNGVPAGDYLAAAVDRSDEGDMQDPAFIARLSRIATKVTVATEPVTLDLTRAKVGR